MRSCLRNYRIELNIRKDARELYYPRAASLISLVPLSQGDENGLIQLGRSLYIYYLRLIVRVRSVYSYLLHLYFKDREELGVLEVVRGQ